MAPTLNAPATSNEGTVERLLMRLLHAPVLGREETGGVGVFPGDVVAFQSPVVKTATRDILVRRVAAVEGQELVTDDPQEPSYILPPGALPQRYMYLPFEGCFERKPEAAPSPVLVLFCLHYFAGARRTDSM